MIGSLFTALRVIKKVFRVVPALVRGVRFIVKAVRFGKKVRGKR